MVHVRTEELRRFIQRAQELVPAGEEHLYLDLDQGLTDLLGEDHGPGRRGEHRAARP
ncbi:hypothetical protein SCALM49S_04691 [Streptomyces californicus]